MGASVLDYNAGRMHDRPHFGEYCSTNKSFHAVSYIVESPFRFVAVESAGSPRESFTGLGSIDCVEGGNSRR